MSESQQPVALGQKFYPGDLAVPINGKILHCATFQYPDAVVVSVNPFVLVSQSGDMVWSCTVKPEVFETNGVASHTALINAFVRYSNDACDQLAERQKFKDWVHAYLDTHGVPHHPPGTHGEHGCRIGDRMDWLMEQLDRLRAERNARQETVEVLRTENVNLRSGHKPFGDEAHSSELDALRSQVTEVSNILHCHPSECVSAASVSKADLEDARQEADAWKSENTRHMREAENMATLVADHRRQRDALLALYQDERAWRRDYHVPRPSWSPYSSESELHGRLRCLREVREYTEAFNAETEQKIKAVIEPEMTSTPVAATTP